MAKIVGPASLNVDITAYTPHLPVLGETTMGTALAISPGGKGFNQMVAAHRAGANAVMIGKKGRDALGAVLDDFCKSEGLSMAHVASGDTETGCAVIEIDERDAQNRIIVISGANAKVDYDTVMAAEAEFADADVVLTQLETTVGAVTAAKELAQKYGKPFILNTAPYVDLPERVFDGVDFVTPNESEAKEFTGVAVSSIADCKKAADRFFEMGVKNVIITLGVRGAYFTDGKKEVVVPAIRMDAVETTGAGDAFNGGFATAIGEGHDVETAMKFATCTSAISVTRKGAAQSMPSREEILALLKEKFGITL